MTISLTTLSRKSNKNRSAGFIQIPALVLSTATTRITIQTRLLRSLWRTIAIPRITYSTQGMATLFGFAPPTKKKANRVSSWRCRKYVLTRILSSDRIFMVSSGTGRCQTLRRLSPVLGGDTSRPRPYTEGVVLRAANKNTMIASGNHTIITGRCGIL